MTQEEIDETFRRNQKKFLSRMEQEFKERGYFECQCRICDCPIKEKLQPHTMQVFVTPQYDIEWLCMKGLRMYGRVYNFKIPE
jgi:hypothetical protein